MAAQDLTTLTRLKAWMSLGSSNMPNDTVLGILNTGLSTRIINYLQRDSFASRRYTDYFDGQGHTRQFVEHWPVSSVSAVVIDGQTIPAATMATDGTSSPIQGFRFENWDGLPPGDPCQVELVGYTFCRGKQNVAITYEAGYLQDKESAVVTAGVVTAQMPYGVWIADNGVTYADGTALTFVSSNPSVGQYALDSSTLGGYVFNSGDDTRPVLISYSFCPFDVELVLFEWAQEIYAMRNRPGQASHNLAGQESGTFSVKYGIPPWAAEALQPYMSVIPV
jgi:hypothetical protein